MPGYAELEIPWDSQPQEAVGVNWGNPLARDLRFAFLGSNPQYQPPIPGGANNQIITGAPVQSATRHGLGPKFASNSYYTYSCPDWLVTDSTPTTIVAIVRRDGTFQTNAGIIVKETVLQQRIGLGTQSTGVEAIIGVKSSWGVTAVETTLLGLGESAIYVSAYDGATTLSLYKNGIFQSASTRSSSLASGGTSQITVGTEGSALSARWLNGTLPVGFGFSRLLSASEIKSISDNPWQLFSPRSIWVPVSAGGGPPPSIKSPYYHQMIGDYHV